MQSAVVYGQPTSAGLSLEFCCGSLQASFQSRSAPAVQNLVGYTAFSSNHLLQVHFGGLESYPAAMPKGWQVANRVFYLLDTGCAPAGPLRHEAEYPYHRHNSGEFKPLHAAFVESDEGIGLRVLPPSKKIVSLAKLADESFEPVQSFLDVFHAGGVADPDVLIGTESDARHSSYLLFF